jgi:tetratricopeptide (TPR) repeat protein
MVRMRCRIGEDDEAAVAAEKLHAALEEHILDPDERAFVEPRLVQLLGAGDDETRDRQDLFSAWRLFFERLCDAYPTILAFEDMQWADESLLDFVEYLLEWSRNHPLFVITMARPELADKRPAWGAGHRYFTSLYLEPLSQPAMEALLEGLVPGLPDSIGSQILARAEGVPLYAVETVRMLLDRGLIAEDGAAYRVAGEVESLEVPETLHALIAARLDGLAADERRVVGDAAVLGKTFTLDALAVLSDLPREDLERLLKGLVRREVLGLQSDARSPEKGQYGFLQDLLRQVAYETLPKRERRAKHVAAAGHLSASLGEDEVAEVVASHYLDAYRLEPDAPDGPEIRSKAHAALVRAGERAASLGAAAEAQRYFEQAAELAETPAEQAAACFRSGEMAVQAGANDRAASLFERAAAAHESLGETHAAARAEAWAAFAVGQAGRAKESEERLERAYARIAGDEPDADVALVLTRLAQRKLFSGDPDAAAALNERALDVCEAFGLVDELLRAWNVKANLITDSRPREARAMFQLSLETALAHGRRRDILVSTSNLSDLEFRRDRYRESLPYIDQTLVLARRSGDRAMEWFALAEQSYALTMLGRWDDALAVLDTIPDERLGADVNTASTLSGPLEILVHRGELDRARSLLRRFDPMVDTVDVQMRAAFHAAEAAVRLAEGDARDALRAADVAFAGDGFGIAFQSVKIGFIHGGEAALALGDVVALGQMLERVEREPTGLRPPLLAASVDRFRARLAGSDPAADELFGAAARRLREIALPFHVAVVLVEHAEWLAEEGRRGDAEPLVADARAILEELGATALLARVAALDASAPSQVEA